MVSYSKCDQCFILVWVLAVRYDKSNDNAEEKDILNSYQEEGNQLYPFAAMLPDPVHAKKQMKELIMKFAAKFGGNETPYTGSVPRMCNIWVYRLTLGRL